MLLTQLCELTASGYKISDSGLSDEPVTDAARSQAIRADMREALRKLRHFQKQLNELGVKASENPDPDYDRLHECFEFAAHDRKLALACRAAFAIGFYTGVLDEKHTQVGIAALRSFRGKKAGDAGGAAVAGPRQQRAAKILDAYGQWASRPENANKDDSVFVAQFAAKEKRKRGFSKPTIYKVIRSLRDKILAKQEELKSSSITTAKRNAAVAKAMSGQSGVCLETVRRALS